MAERKVGQPGLFVASRPLLTIILTFGIIGLIGFSGGLLMEEAARQTFHDRILAYLQMTLMATLALVVPAIAPGAVWGRVLLALGIFSAGMLIFGFGGAAPAGSLTAVLILIVVLCLLVLVAPFTGRILPLYALLAPLCGLAGLAGFLGYLIRQGLPSEPALLTLQMLGFSAAIMTGIFFTERLSRYTVAGYSNQASAAAALNEIIRDVFFLAFAGALLFQFYVRDEGALSNGQPLLWSGFAALLLCAAPAAFISAAVISCLPGAGALGQSREQADRAAVALLGDALKRLTPAIYLAALVIVAILVSILFPEVPLAAFTAIESGAGAAGSLLIRGLFFVMIFVLAAVLYTSVRLAAAVLVVFLLGDILAATILAEYVLDAGGAMRLVDITPRLIVLYFLVQVALSWRRGIEAAAGGRADGIAAAAKIAGPGMLAVLICLVVFVAASILIPEQQALADYAALRLFLQAVLSLLILPMAMAVFARFRVSI